MTTFLKHFRPLPTLNSPRLSLRRAYLTDVEDLFICMHNPKVCLYEVWHAHKTHLETLGFVNMLITRYDNHTCTDWVIERKSDNRAIGVINLHDFSVTNRYAEIGFWLAEDCWRNGFATESALLVLDFAFHTLKLNKVSGLCTSENNACKQLLQHLGMTYEGTLRKHIKMNNQFQDIDVFSILSEEFRLPQNS